MKVQQYLDLFQYDLYLPHTIDMHWKGQYLKYFENFLIILQNSGGHQFENSVSWSFVNDFVMGKKCLKGKEYYRGFPFYLISYFIILVREETCTCISRCANHLTIDCNWCIFLYLYISIIYFMILYVFQRFLNIKAC